MLICEVNKVAAYVATFNFAKKAKKQFGFIQDNNTVLIGDTPWDINAATKAGVKSTEVSTGIYDAGLLKEIGASTVSSGVGKTQAFLEAIAKA